jgi:cytoskeletal protein CcmA (bactofilin family)
MSMRTADQGEFTPTTMAEGQSPDAASLATGGTAESFSVVDRHSQFDGVFHSNRDLRIDGEVKGTIECQGTLFVAQGANVNAKIEAENVTVAGDLHGEVNCRGRLQIMPSGRLRGKVNTQTLVINEGAYYEGQLDMVNPDVRLPQGRNPRPLAPVSQPVPMPSSNAPAAKNAAPTPPPPPPAQETPAAGSKTFIRRFGGPETPWDGAPGDADDSDEDTQES